MSEHKRIIGAGGGGGKGGGGGGRTPVEDPDSLRSRQYARVLDLVSEGPIEGLVAGAQSIYLDGTPVLNPDDSINFSGVSWTARHGAQVQSAIAGFGAVENEVAVGAEVKFTDSVTRTLTNPNLTAARVTIGIPALSYQDPNTGDIQGTSVELAIDIQNNGGGWVTQYLGGRKVLDWSGTKLDGAGEVIETGEMVDYDIIVGKTTSRYQRSYRLELPAPGPWDIRVRRLTADSTQTNLQNKTYWESVTEIIDQRLTYPNSALVAVQADAAAFRSIPKRAYDLKGLLIRVPSNYTPATRAYAGLWDGTFQTLWSDNPAWVFYDLITNDRYGLGGLIDPALVDKWALYGIAQYCDALVPDGFGGQEPRFTCNLYLQTQEEAYKVVTHLASIFRGMVFWSGGGITAVQDAPADPAALFTAANVVEGAFTYQGSARTNRHTVARVSWNDPADRYRQKIEYVEDAEGIARYGVLETDAMAVGCTSRGQAHRLGLWLLYTERMETEVVGFRAGMDSAGVMPGDVIQIADASRAGARMGGRLAGCTATQATLDAEVTLEAGQSYTLWVVPPDGVPVSRPVATAAGVWTVLDWASPLPAVPVANAIWVLAASNLAPTLWRVISVAEADKGIVEISALSHNPSKYAAIEQGLQLVTPPTSIISAVPGAVSNLQISEALYAATPTRVEVRVTATWIAPGNAVNGYDVRVRRDFGNWQLLPRTTVTTVSIDNAVEGFWEFSVTAISAAAQAGPAVTAGRQVLGRTVAPQALSGFSVRAITGVAHFSWDLSPDLDVRIGGRISVRWSNAALPAWENAVVIEEFAGNATTGVGALLGGTYFIKARDASGNWAVDAASFVVTEALLTGFATVGTVAEDPGFAGAKTGTIWDGDELILNSLGLIDDQSEVDALGLIDFMGGVQASGEYAFANVLDLTTVAARRWQADVTAAFFDIGNQIDVRFGDVDDWGDLDGAAVNDCDVTLYASTTNDNPAGSPVWGAWTPFFNADFTCRAARFKAVLASGNPNHGIKVSRLRVSAKTPA